MLNSGYYCARRIIRIGVIHGGISDGALIRGLGRLFRLAERHTLVRHDRIAQTFPTEPTDLQCQVLSLLGVPEHAFRG